MWSLSGVSLKVISAEDLVITKILAGRPKDLDDVRSVLRARGPALDVRGVREFLRLLEEALGQSDLTPALENVLSGARAKADEPGQ